jgi:fatty acid desaturase
MTVAFLTSFTFSASNDFGIYQLSSIIDCSNRKSNQFWTLVSFGQHILHHFFPTLDHGLLPQLHDTFVEVCQEFDQELRELNCWQLIVGQFQQLQRTKPRTREQMKLKK